VTAPLILTLLLDPASQTVFDQARTRWFPVERNVIAAHVTLFHHLPGQHLATITTQLAPICRDQTPVSVAVTGLRSLGRGVAYTLHAPALEALRTRLAKTWHDDLTPQDRQTWRPHVTIQNKVSPPDARALLDHLSAAFTPFSATATGLALWWYRGGPWEHQADIPFTG
jgi:2'-5' RNA ligase